MENDKKEDLMCMLQASRSMLTSAEADDWQAVVGMEDKRRLVVERFFAIPVSDVDASDVAAVVNQMVNIDKRIMELGDAAKEACGKGMRKLNGQRNVARAYASNT